MLDYILIGNRPHIDVATASEVSGWCRHRIRQLIKKELVKADLKSEKYWWIDLESFALYFAELKRGSVLSFIDKTDD